MRNKILLLIIVLNISFQLIAQNNDETEWVTFVGNQEEFVVNAPAGFLLVDSNTDAEDSFKAYRTKMNGQTYAVWTSKNKQASYFSIFSTFIQNNNAQGTETLIDSFKGSVFNFNDLDGISHKIAFVDTDSRFFIFHTFGSSVNNEAVAKFFDSIKIKKTFSQSNYSSPLSAIQKTETKPTNVKSEGNGRGQGAGTGMGSGQGVGSGQGSGNGSDKPIENPTSEKTIPVVVPLQILSKPSANYTDMARIYGIQGTVSLRVTFKADGTIGSVSPISGLALGLTRAAIESAKKLTFKPASRDGIPQTVVRTVQYSFTLY